MIGRSILLALLFALTGCAGLTGPRQDFSIYTLNPAVSPGEGPAVDWQLMIEEPHVSELLDGFRILVATADNERQVYKGARWVERTPGLLQGIWLRAFETDGRLPGAARAGTGVRADLILSPDVNDFQARDTIGSPAVEVSIHARLIDPRSRRILARRAFDADIPTASNQIADIVAGFDAALEQINPKLIEWTLREGERAMAASRNTSP